MIESNHLDIPGHVTLTEGNGGLPKVLVDTEWSTAEVYLHGAHVTGFQKKGEEPLLFMSAESEFNAKMPIRGGIPVIFPWFGGREGLPAHGFARTVGWDLKETSLTSEKHVRLRFSLPAIRLFEVDYFVTVAETLSLALVVTNAAKHAATFETCLHTYFSISSIDAISITGLKDTGYLDKVKDARELETGAEIRIASEVDRVFSDASGPVEILDPGFGRKIRVTKSGSDSTVVWNPWIDKSKAMPDFGADEYQRMVCVESGNVGTNQLTLPAGTRATMLVTLGSERLE